MKNQTPIELIRKYLDGLTTETENRTLYEWISESGSNLAEFGKIKRNHDRLALMTVRTDSPEQARGKTDRKIVARRRRRRRNIAAAAVSAAAVLLTALFVTVPTHTDTSTDQIAYQTERGEQKGITLPDGSVVTINAESKLSYIFDDARNLRLVFLTGEAFFDIVRDTLNPFIVRTDHVNARVLGTKFNMSAYPTDRVVETTIIEGRVALSVPGSDVDPIEVTANDRATLVKGSNSFRLDHVDASAVAQWIDGALVFRETCMEDIAARLERYYDVTVTLADRELRTMVYTATFDRGTPIANILDLLAFTSPIEYTIDGNLIEIKLKKQ